MINFPYSLAAYVSILAATWQSYLHDQDFIPCCVSWSYQRL